MTNHQCFYTAGWVIRPVKTKRGQSTHQGECPLPVYWSNIRWVGVFDVRLIGAMRSNRRSGTTYPRSYVAPSSDCDSGALACRFITGPGCHQRQTMTGGSIDCIPPQPAGRSHRPVRLIYAAFETSAVPSSIDDYRYRREPPTSRFLE